MSSGERTRSRRGPRVPLWRRARRILGLNARNLLYVHGLNPRRHFPLADNKILTKRVLETAGVPTPETLAVLRSLTGVTHARPLLEKFGAFAAKPARGRQGSGIILIAGCEGGRFLKLDGTGLAWDDLRRSLGDILFGVHSIGQSDHVLIERLIRPHPGLGSLAQLGLPDTRIILLGTRPAMAMMRVPTRASGGRANLHQGAIGVAIRLRDGLASRAVWRGEATDCHPDTGARMIDFTMPMWKEIVGVARRAAAALPLPYLGVDVVLDGSRGPLVMEANVRPGLEIQNVNRAGLRRRLERLAGSQGGSRA